MCAYQGETNVRFSENLACFVFLKHLFWDSLFCLITDVLTLANPPAEFFWYKDNKELADSWRYRIEEDEEAGETTLIIQEVQADHSGKYKCVAVNEKGKAFSTAELFVEGEFKG